MSREELFGPYRLLEKLGAGGMAEVFLSRRGDGERPRVAAVKRALPSLLRNPASLAMFANEQRIAAQLSHPNIARIFEVGEVDGRPFIAMELILGPSLGGLRKRCRGRPADMLGHGATLRLICDVCAGLHHAHELGEDGSPELVHGDVHLHNVLITYGGNTKVIDFGVARAGSELGLGQPGGTYAYMAPEQLKGQPFDRRADVFAVGALAWELFTGVPLFRRRTAVRTMTAVVEQPPPRLGAYMPKHRWREAEALGAVLGRALEKDPGKRFASCEQLATALEATAQEMGWAHCDGELRAAMERIFARERAVIESGLARYGDIDSWLAEKPSEVPLVL